jgi:hypothetical protein
MLCIPTPPTAALQTIFAVTERNRHWRKQLVDCNRALQRISGLPVYFTRFNVSKNTLSPAADSNFFGRSAPGSA